MMKIFFKAYNIVLVVVVLLNIQGLYSQPQSTPVSVDTVETNPDSVFTKSTLQQSLEQTQPKIAWSISLAKVLWTIILFVIAFIIIKYFTRLLEMLSERWARLRLFLKRVIPVFRISVWTFVIYIIIIGILRPPIQTLVAFTASAGIAIGFASQDILKNIFGGIMILFDRPFQVGDKIQIGNYYGEVKQIGLRTVRIVTADDSMVSIPNSEIVNQSVSNSNSGEFNCQVVAELYLPPDIDLVLLKKIAYKVAAVSQYVYLKKPVAVIIKNEVHHNRSWLKVRLKAYVLDLRYEFPFMSEMTENLINILLKKGLITSADLGFIRENKGS